MEGTAPMRRLFRAILASGVTLVAVSCASPSSGVRQGQESTSLPEPSASQVTDLPFRPEINWDNPIDGIAVDSVAEAEAATGFDVIVPQNLGTVSAIFVSGSDVPDDNRVVALIFDSTYGRVDVLENLPPLPTDEYLASQIQYVESHRDNPHLVGSVSIVHIRGSLQGLLTVTGDARWSALFWLENGLEITVWGPELVAEDSLAIAETIW